MAKMGCDGAMKEQRFSMLLRLSWYKFKLDYNLGMLNVICMVTTKKIAIDYTQNEVKKQEMKHFTKNTS